MCELLAMSARFPTTIHLSMDELASHGGRTGPHRDGWGLAFLQERDALIVREPVAAASSEWLACVQRHDVRSAGVIAHVRRATQGPPMLCNTQPFSRELGGRVHVFAHNGTLAGIEGDARFAAGRFRRVGDTDSEHAFCALLERLAPLWEAGEPQLDARLAELVRFAAQLRELGPANFLYSDGAVVFAHAHRRHHADGAIRPPGLHVLCRTCKAGDDGVALAAVSLPHDARQEVALVASVPLSDERWEALPEGALVALQAGRVIARA